MGKSFFLGALIGIPFLIGFMIFTWYGWIKDPSTLWDFFLSLHWSLKIITVAFLVGCLHIIFVEKTPLQLQRAAERAEYQSARAAYKKQQEEQQEYEHNLTKLDDKEWEEHKQKVLAGLWQTNPAVAAKLEAQLKAMAKARES